MRRYVLLSTLIITTDNGAQLMRKVGGLSRQRQTGRDASSLLSGQAGSPLLKSYGFLLSDNTDKSG